MTPSSANPTRSTLGERVTYGAVAIVFLLAIFLLDLEIAQNSARSDGILNELLARGSMVPLLFVVMASAGAVEMRRLLRATGAQPHAALAHVAIVVLVLTPWLSAAGWLGMGPAQVEGMHWQVVWLAGAAIATAVLSVIRGRTEGVLRDTGATALLIVYLGFLTSFGLQMRCGRDVPGQEGAYLLLISLLVIKASDIGAYLVGSQLGRHKLAPALSPGKTVEGFIGGILGSIFVAVLFVYLPDVLDSYREAEAPAPSDTGLPPYAFAVQLTVGGIPPVVRAVLFGIVMSAVAQIGDLLESCFKRDADIKDSGNVLPTFGGILDLLDSPVMALPVAWFLLTVVWGVV